jgi:hypothetical protein
MLPLRKFEMITFKNAGMSADVQVPDSGSCEIIGFEEVSATAGSFRNQTCDGMPAPTIAYLNINHIGASH